MKRSCLIVVGVAAALFSTPAPHASAQLGTGPLIETTCSYAQLEAALRVEAPEAANRLQQRPEARIRIQELLGLPVDQRRQRVQSFLDRNPDVASRIEDKRSAPEYQDWSAKARRVADTCHNY